jgi:O-antigen ligase
MNIDESFKKVIHYVFYILFFTVPLIFIPGHVELFQFNKMMLVYFSATLVTTLWLLRMIRSNKILLYRTPLDIPLLFFLLSQAVSTLLSINPHTSLWGYYSRFHQGLFSTISYILLYYAFTFHAFENLQEKKKSPIPKLVKGSLVTLLISATVVSLYGILEHFGIDENYWIQDVRNRVFSTLGQPNWLAAFLVTIIPLTFLPLLNNQTNSSDKFPERAWTWLKAWLNIHVSKDNQFKSFVNKKISVGTVSIILISVCFTTILYTKSRSGLLGFIVMYVSFWSFIFLKNIFLKSSEPFKLQRSFIKTSVIIVILSLVIGTPFSPNFTDLSKKLISKEEQPLSALSPEQTPPPALGGTPSGEIRKIVWRGAIEVWKNWPIFGSGVETFAYSYYNFRPIEHNFVSEWDFLYNKAHNEYLNFAATTGTFGLGSYLLLQIWFIAWSIKQIFYLTGSLNSSERPSHPEHARRDMTSLAVAGPFSLLISLLAGYLGLAVTNFFGFSTVTTGLLFFMLPAFATATLQKKPKLITLNLRINKFLKILLLFIVIALFLFITSNLAKRWYADRLFARGKALSRANQISEALDLQQRAASLSPHEPIFHDLLALDLARSASALFQKGELETALLFSKTAKAHSDLVMIQNPLHINFLKNRAATMLHLSTIDPDYKHLALKALQRAEELSPTDPKIPYNIGLFHQQEKDIEMALNKILESLKLKSDYLDARLTIASIYENLDQQKEARIHYQFILKNIDPNNPQATQALEKP